MINKVISPVDILCRELHRLDNDADRLQMLVTLKSHLNNLQFTSNTLQLVFSIFDDEQYRLQAINQLLPFIYILITSENVSKLLELFANNENRLNLIETLKNCDPLKANKEVNEILINESRQYFQIKQIIKISENPNDTESNSPIFPTSNVVEVLPNTSGVFEKAKQFVCRVFGGGGSSSSSLNKRLINEVSSLTDNTERKKFHPNDLQFQPTSMSLSTSQSYTSIITKSPPPSPITRQSSMSFHIDESSVPIQSMMVTQIHSILDNIDSVLDKIEAQSTSVIRRPALLTSNELPNQTIDQITQTTINILEHHLNMNDGSGDTTPGFTEEDMMD